MTDNSDDTKQAIAVLDHFELGGGNKYAEFDIIDPETGDPVGGIHPYINAEALTESAGVSDTFRITYDAETEEIATTEYLADETQTQKSLNAKRLIDLQDEDFISTADESRDDKHTVQETSSHD